MFGKAIGDAPLQVYISALLFSPTESIIHKQFSAEAPHWARIWPTDVTNWTSCVQKLDGDSKAWYETLSVSSCGTWLAAREDGIRMIRIWDIEACSTLCHIKFLTIPGARGWFKFSLRNNNELIVYQSLQDSLEIWDITSSKIVRQIGAPLKNRFFISLLPSAPDFLGMIFHVKDTIGFALWNTQDGGIDFRSLSLKAHVNHIAFSPANNDILAMDTKTTNGRQIIIFNIDTDNIVRRFDFGWIRYISFSPNGKYLASFTKPNHDTTMPTCTLLDTMTGETILEIEMQSHPNGAPAFSNDGQLLAVGSNNLIQI